MFPTRYKSSAKRKTIPEKFSRVPIEDDTSVVFEIYLTLKQEPYGVLYQYWLWDGIKGESVIFCNADIDNLQDEQVIKLVEETELIKNNDSTIKRGSGYTFVNFNFEIIEFALY